jgi:hypothetical protein
MCEEVEKDAAQITKNKKLKVSKKGEQLLRMIIKNITNNCSLLKIFRTIQNVLYTFWKQYI